MAIVQNKIFKIQLPATFEIYYDKPTFFRAQSNEPFKVQIPLYSGILLPIIEIKESPGRSLDEQLLNFSAYYKAEIITQNTKKLKGYDCYVIKQMTDIVQSEKPIQVYYEDIYIKLNDEFFLNFQLICDLDKQDYFSGLIENSMESLQIIADLKEQQKAYDDYEKHLDTLEQNNQKPSYIEIQREKVEQIDMQQLAFSKIAIVNEMPLDIINQSCSISFEGSLNIKFSFRPHDIAKARKQGWIKSWFEEDETLDLDYSFFNCYTPKGPQSQVEFLKNNNMFRWNNLSTSTEFIGKVNLYNNELKMNGYFVDELEEKTFPVLIMQTIDIKNLDWSRYLFQNEELLEAPTNLVQKIKYTDNDMSYLPQGLFEFINCKELSVIGGKSEWNGQEWVAQRAPINSIPKDIDKLVQLEKLELNHLSITTVPESLTKLKHLNQLFIIFCQLESLPGGLLSFEKLRLLYLSDNNLSKLPEQINLPSCTYIRLENNQLTTLPESICDQAKLNHLNLKNNPWESLPNCLNQDKITIDLAIEEKLRLLNYDYQGADGLGIKKWDDSLFYWHSEEKSSQNVLKTLRQLKNPQLETALFQLDKKAIGFNALGPDNYKEVGNTRFGGNPDLPKSIEYPRFGKNWREGKEDYVYEFLAQINCAEVNHLQDYLPRKGMLYFFLSTIHDVYDESDAVKVIYYNGEDQLISGQHFNFEEEDYDEVFQSPAYSPVKAAPFAMHSFPYFYSYRSNPQWFTYKNGPELKKALENQKSYNEINGVIEKINEDNSVDAAINNYMFTQNEGPEIQAAQVKRGNPNDWVVLLMLSSQISDFQWGDAGDLAIMIHKNDLLKQDFGNVYVTMESS